MDSPRKPGSLPRDIKPPAVPPLNLQPLQSRVSPGRIESRANNDLLPEITETPLRNPERLFARRTESVNIRIYDLVKTDPNKILDYDGTISNDHFNKSVESKIANINTLQGLAKADAIVDFVYSVIRVKGGEGLTKESIDKIMTAADGWIKDDHAAVRGDALWVIGQLCCANYLPNESIGEWKDKLAEGPKRNTILSIISALFSQENAHYSEWLENNIHGLNKVLGLATQPRPAQPLPLHLPDERRPANTNASIDTAQFQILQSELTNVNTIAQRQENTELQKINTENKQRLTDLEKKLQTLKAEKETLATKQQRELTEKEKQAQQSKAETTSLTEKFNAEKQKLEDKYQKDSKLAEERQTKETNQLKQDLQDFKFNTTSEIEALKANHQKELQKKDAAAQRKEEEFAKERQALENERKKSQKLSDQIEKLKATIPDSSKKTQGNDQEMKRLKAESSKLNKQLLEKDTYNEELLLENGTLNDELQSTKLKAQEAASENNALSEKLKAQSKANTELQQKYEDIQNELAKTKKSEDSTFELLDTQISGLKEKNKTLSEEKAKATDIAEGAILERQRLEGENKFIKTEYQGMKEKNRKLDEKNIDLDEEIFNLEGERDELKRQKEQLDKEIIKLGKEIKNLNTKSQKDDQQNKELQRKIQELEEQYAKLKTEAEKLKTDNRRLIDENSSNLRQKALSQRNLLSGLTHEFQTSAPILKKVGAEIELEKKVKELTEKLEQITSKLDEEEKTRKSFENENRSLKESNINLKEKVKEQALSSGKLAETEKKLKKLKTKAENLEEQVLQSQDAYEHQLKQNKILREDKLPELQKKIESNDATIASLREEVERLKSGQTDNASLVQSNKSLQEKLDTQEAALVEINQQFAAREAALHGQAQTAAQGFIDSQITQLKAQHQAELARLNQQIAGSAELQSKFDQALVANQTWQAQAAEKDAAIETLRIENQTEITALTQQLQAEIEKTKKETQQSRQAAQQVQNLESENVKLNQKSKEADKLQFIIGILQQKETLGIIIYKTKELSPPRTGALSTAGNTKYSTDDFHAFYDAELEDRDKTIQKQTLDDIDQKINGIPERIQGTAQQINTLLSSLSGATDFNQLSMLYKSLVSDNALLQEQDRRLSELSKQLGSNPFQPRGRMTASSVGLNNQRTMFALRDTIENLGKLIPQLNR